jgi:hypothetical protein
MQQTLVIYECINGGRERERDSDNFGTRITENGVPVVRIWAFDVLGQNGHFRRFQGVYLEFKSAWGYCCKKIGAYVEIGQFIRLELSFGGLRTVL